MNPYNTENQSENLIFDTQALEKPEQTYLPMIESSNNKNFRNWKDQALEPQFTQIHPHSSYANQNNMVHHSHQLQPNMMHHHPEQNYEEEEEEEEEDDIDEDEEYDEEGEEIDDELGEEEEEDEEEDEDETEEPTEHANQEPVKADMVNSADNLRNQRENSKEQLTSAGNNNQSAGFIDGRCHRPKEGIILGLKIREDFVGA